MEKNQYNSACEIPLNTNSASKEGEELRSEIKRRKNIKKWIKKSK